MLLALKRERRQQRRQQQQVKAVEGLGLGGAGSSHGCDRCQSALTAARFSSCLGGSRPWSSAREELWGFQREGRQEGWELLGGIWLLSWLQPEQLSGPALGTAPLWASVSSSATGRGWVRPVFLHPGGPGPGHHRFFKAFQEILTSWMETHSPRVYTAGLSKTRQRKSARQHPGLLPDLSSGNSRGRFEHL